MESSSSSSSSSSNIPPQAWRRLMKTPTTSSSSKNAFQQIATAIPIGALFGYLAQTSGIYAPAVIRSQFIFEKNILFKVFFSACAGSAFAMLVLYNLNRRGFQQARSVKEWGERGAISGCLGGLIQGAGMALAGACPGMAYVQIGTGEVNSLWLYSGLILGAWTYFWFMRPLLSPYLALDFRTTLAGRFDSMHLDQQWFNHNYPRTAGLFGTIALLVAIAINQFGPSWEEEIKTVNGVDQHLAMSPILAGLGIGLLQIPLFLFLDSALLGMSSGYTCLASQFPQLSLHSQSNLGNITVHPSSDADDDDNGKRMPTIKSNKSIFQIGLGLGAIIGSAFASRNVPNSQTAHVSALEAVVGGFLIILGARLANGCTSGHGITGLPSLNVLSWIAAPSMFLGGILMGNVLNAMYGSREYLLNGSSGAAAAATTTL